jgi:hypothetical protein
MRRHHLVLIALVLVAGCDPARVLCSPAQLFAIYVAPIDAVSRTPVPEGATLIIRDGTYVDSAQFATGLADRPVLVAGFDRAGTYDVLVRRPGYRNWTREGVRVTRGGTCGDVRPVELIAELERVPITASQP